MNIHPAQIGDESCLIELMACFREALARMRGVNWARDIPAARSELGEYKQKGFPMFVAEEDGAGLAGYLVCRVEGEVAWVESLFVLPEYRRKGVASLLYAEAERLAAGLGGDAPYNWVDPGNEAMLKFLASRGYDVLNLIELRRAREGEFVPGRISVGRNEFRSRTGGRG